MRPFIEIQHDSGAVVLNVMHIIRIEPDAESRVTIYLTDSAERDDFLNFVYPGGYSAFRDMLRRQGVLEPDA